MPHIAHLRRSVGWAFCHGGCERTCPREAIGAAQCVGQPVPASHAPHQVRYLGAGHLGLRDFTGQVFWLAK